MQITNEIFQKIQVTKKKLFENKIKINVSSDIYFSCFIYFSKKTIEIFSY